MRRVKITKTVIEHKCRVCEATVHEEHFYKCAKGHLQGCEPHTKELPDGEGYFHTWSTNYEELGDGVALYPVAIVERDDGTVVDRFVRQIQFIGK